MYLITSLGELYLQFGLSKKVWLKQKAHFPDKSTVWVHNDLYLISSFGEETSFAVGTFKECVA